MTATPFRVKEGLLLGDSTKLQVDGSGDLTVKDASNNLKRVVASEIEIGTGANKIKVQRGANGKVKFTDENDIPTPVLQIVGDDSTGVSLNTNETVKIAGTQNITTAVSGDTLTITGPDLTSYITASSTDTLTNKTIDANGTGNSISNLEVTDFASAAFKDEDNMASNSATAVASQQSIKAYVDNAVGSLSSNSISAGNTSATITDAGTGNMTVTVDGTTHSVFNASGITLSQGNFIGTATSAQYADLAERYHADRELEPGTVVKLGGEYEITPTTIADDTDVLGVISTNPAVMMNSKAGENTTHPYVALAGRVQVKVQGPINKGDRLVTSDIEGVAKKVTDLSQTSVFSVIGRSLETYTDNDLTMVEIIVGKF